jgi:hypothetical protein
VPRALAVENRVEAGGHCTVDGRVKPGHDGWTTAMRVNE